MYKPSIEKTLEVFARKNYSLNTSEYSLNIFCIRESEKTDTIFADTLCVLYKTGYGDYDLVAFSICGDISLRFKPSPILNEDVFPPIRKQYKESLKLFSLPGQSASLVSARVCEIFDTHNFAEQWLNESEPGFLEINHKPYLRLHTASRKNQLNPHAQVLETEGNMKEFLELVKQSILITENNLFDYTIFSSADFK